MRIAMIGTGYVGLVSGACFADFGHQVTCVDKDGDKIAALRRGEIPIFEPGLDALVAANVKAGRLDFATDLAAPVAEADAVHRRRDSRAARQGAVRTRLCARHEFVLGVDLVLRWSRPPGPRMAEACSP